MGVYLSTPSVEKISIDQTLEHLTFGASSMQGWRKSQEDSHNCCPEFDIETGTYLFAVYDGHGGAEVAEYASRHLPDFIKSNKNYQDNMLSEALVEAFLDFDAALISEEAQKELLSIAQLDKTEMPDENETEKLKEEAHMPIEELLKGYGGVGSLPDDVKEVYQNNKRFLKNADKNHGSPATLLAKCNGQDKCASNDVKAKLNQKVPNGHTDEPVNGAKPVCASDRSRVVSSTTTDQNDGDVISTSPPPHATTAADTTTTTTTARCASDDEDKSVSSTDVDSKQDTTDNDQLTNDAVVKTSLYLNETNTENEAMSSNENAGTEPSEDEDEEEEEEEDGDEVWSDTSSEDDAEASSDQDDVTDHNDTEDQGDEAMVATFNDDEKPGYDSGCTAVLALIRDRTLYVANAGDSRCVLCRAGKALDLSIDHKPEDEKELKRIKRAGGMVSFDGRVNGGLNLSRALGDHCYKGNADLALKDQMISGLPDIQSTQLQDDDDFLVLACDGIWNSLTSQEVVDFVRKRLDKGVDKLSEICEELFDHCLAPNTSGDGTGCDNMTAILVCLQHDKSASPDATVVTSCAGRMKRSADGTSPRVNVPKRAKIASSSSNTEDSSRRQSHEDDKDIYPCEGV